MGIAPEACVVRFGALCCAFAILACGPAHVVTDVSPRDLPETLERIRENPPEEPAKLSVSTWIWEKKEGEMLSKDWRCVGSYRAPLSSVEGDTLTLGECSYRLQALKGAQLLTPEEPFPEEPEKTGQRHCRHRVGVQAGGTAFLQAVYRRRLVSGFELDLGFFGAPGFVNGSLGLVATAPMHDWLRGYLGGGGGFVAAFGATADPSCRGDRACPYVDGSLWRGFGYLRTGLALAVSETNEVGLGVAVWYGSTRENDGAGVETRDLVLVVPGLSFLHGS